MGRTWNRADYNASWRRWYRENAARKMAWQAKRREEIRRWWAELKSTKACEVCAENAPECLHFHHIDPRTKEIDLARAASNGWSKKRILDEVAKCRVLCANCHLKHHWDEKNSRGDRI